MPRKDIIFPVDVDAIYLRRKEGEEEAISVSIRLYLSIQDTLSESWARPRNESRKHESGVHAL